MKKDNPMPEIPSNRGDDIHNIEFMDDADLILFMAGNQFMVMEELISEFQDRHPEIKKIFYETFPPGLELKQILSGGARFKDMILTGSPDAYTSVTEDSMIELKNKNLITEYSVYLHNRLVLMVAEGNPTGIKELDDLKKDEIRISQPGESENILHYIIDMYRKAGGEGLLNRIMEEKRAEATTIFTVVHHRETPLRIEKGTVDIGPVWATEVINAKRDGQKVEAIEVGEGLDQHDSVNYYITRLSDAPNPENASKFIDFIRSDTAQLIYKNYGFVPYRKV